MNLGEAGRRCRFGRRRLRDWRRFRRAFRLRRARPERDRAERVRQLRLGGGVGSARAQHQDQVTLRDLIADLDLDALHRAGMRRGYFHAGLVAFQGDQRRIDLDMISGRDQYLDDRDILEIADVRHSHLARFAGTAGGGRFTGIGGGTLGRGHALGDIQIQNQVALRDFAASLDLDFPNHAGQWGRHLHGRLVGFQDD